MTIAYKWIGANKGLTTDSAYPFTSGSSGLTGNCVTTGYANIAKTAPTGFVNVAPNSVAALLSAVAQHPVAVGVQASSDIFQFYAGGIISDASCGTMIDHAVLVTGYGTDAAGVDYWRVKNSWSTSWGEQGYARILRSSANICGVLNSPDYPVL